MGRVRAGAGALIAAVKAERKAIILWPDPRSGLLCGPHRLQQDRPVGERGALAERHLERLILARGANPQHLAADLSGPDAAPGRRSAAVLDHRDRLNARPSAIEIRRAPGRDRV